MGVTENEALSLTDALRSELGKSGKYQVMERSQMDDILKEQGFQQSGACDEASCAIEIGKILAVNFIGVGTAMQNTFTDTTLTPVTQYQYRITRPCL
jgi:curli biogenesis system outer membrane secretion channel CsgG